MRRTLVAGLLLAVSITAVAGLTAATQRSPSPDRVVTTSTSPPLPDAADVSTTAAPPTTSQPPQTTTTRPVADPVPVASEPLPPPPPPEPAPLPPAFNQGLVTVAAGGADLAVTPGGEPIVRLREGVVLPGIAVNADRSWIQVYHMCDETAWVDATQVVAELPAPGGDVGAGFDLADAVLVIDPGHGGPSNTGAVSPDGLAEKENNVLIAARVRDLLSEPHSIDWETGRIVDGDDYPAAGRVVVTRSGAGAAADYEAGLRFRARLASVMNAHALVSIHTNAGWEIPTPEPGSDVYYQSQSELAAESRRLAVLLVEEFRRSFAPFEADWVGTIEVGAKSRISPRDGVSQYYGILKNSLVPTVIAEGAYIANPSEAALLRTPEFQQAYADAVYRALVRFVTTDDPGDAPSYDPEVWSGRAGSGDARPDCVLPAQP